MGVILCEPWRDLDASGLQSIRMCFGHYAALKALRSTLKRGIMPKYTIKADITLKGVPLTVESDTPLTEADEAQAFVDQRGFGAGDFDLNLADEEVEVFDVYPAEG